MTTAELPEWARLYDEVAWTHRYGPAEVIGPCTHNCDHRHSAQIATGPSEVHATLRACVSPACTANAAIQCRAWFTARGGAWGDWKGVWIGRQAITRK